MVVRKCGSVAGSKCLESTIPSNEVFISAWVRLVYLEMSMNFSKISQCLVKAIH